ncbi:Uncharacterised protein [Mycobacteroides abscessus subsp. abscessus]|nr:Uncharacterised protein [Mycobacteroides abscessus subsp. abscessus]
MEKWAALTSMITCSSSRYSSTLPGPLTVSAYWAITVLSSPASLPSVYGAP